LGKHRAMIDVDLTGKAILKKRAEEIGIGIIAPFDLVLDREYWQWVPETVSIHLTRTPSSELPMGSELASAISDADSVAQATRDLAVADPKVTVYACTSGSFIRGLAGESRLRAVMTEAGANHAITTSGALLQALEVLEAKRVAIGTPYDAEVTIKLSEFLAEAGYETTSNAFFGLTADIFRVSGASVRDLAAAADCPEADVVFLSCTNLPTFEVLPEIERKLKKPVLSANQVTMWAALRAVGLADDWHRPPSGPVGIESA
jgi:maleate isomerase